MNKTLIDLTSTEAEEYLLGNEAYFNNNLPEYFDFEPLLEALYGEVEKSISCISTNKKSLKKVSDANYHLVLNKDGRLGWRSIELIHPIIYVSLVHLICRPENWEAIKDRFKYFRNDSYVKCCSLPILPNKGLRSKASQISYWWSEFEQQSISFSLKFNCMLKTDVSNCYGSIYTHSIAWALHGKEECKKNLGQKNNQRSLGDQIDQYIQLSRYGQTNGIPQGSILMDIIAELVMGYVDTLITEKIELSIDNGCGSDQEFKILRYRDDYHIFTYNSILAEQILLIISDELRSVGMALNVSKTNVSNDIIQSSIKEDKLVLIQLPNFEAMNAKTLQKKLLFCYTFGIKYPNSGSLVILMAKLNELYFTKAHMSKKRTKKEIRQNYKSLLAIITNIVVSSPRVFPQVSAILSSLFRSIEDYCDGENLQSIWNEVVKKINQIPNNGLFEVWLQRIAIPCKLDFKTEEKMCLIVDNKDASLWNNQWIANNELILNVMKKRVIINEDKMEKLSKIIKRKEIEIFLKGYYTE